MRRYPLASEERREIEGLTRRLSAEHLPGGVEPLVKWDYSRNNMGTAFYSLLCYRDPRITFSVPLFAYATPEDRVETIYHEIAHLVVFYSFANGPSLWDSLRKEGDHGPLFREVMGRFGYLNLDARGISRRESLDGMRATT